jgi:hypothetical protein
MKKEYISPVTKTVLVRLSDSVLYEPGAPGGSGVTNEGLGKQGFFEENQDDEGWASQTNVWSSYDE